MGPHKWYLDYREKILLKFLRQKYMDRSYKKFCEGQKVTSNRAWVSLLIDVGSFFKKREEDGGC